MAQFCTKCGAPLADGMQFCTGCGATVGQPSTPQAPTAPPVSPTPVPGPGAKKGSPILKIVLIVVAVLIFLGAVGAASCVYFVYRAKQKMKQFETQVETRAKTYPIPMGTREVHPQPSTPAPTVPTEAPLDMGVPVYPGATATEGQGEMPLGVGGMKVQQYTTPDSLDKVVAFYKDKFGSKAMVSESGNSALVQATGSNGVINVTISTDTDSGKTTITVTSIQK